MKTRLTSILVIWWSTLLLCQAQQTPTQQDGENIIFNEVMVQNLDQLVDPSWNFGSWAELRNLSDTPYNLKGCWISDDPLMPMKVHLTQNYMLPANGYLTLWFGHADKYCPTQINLKMDIDGGDLYLNDAEGRLIAELHYPESVERTSYARRDDETGGWGINSTPTPTKQNDTIHFYTEQLPAPEPSEPSKVFKGQITVMVPVPAGYNLRYTQDGSVPTLTNGKTTRIGRFNISSSTTLRFRYFSAGYLPSPVTTRTYICEEFDIPIPILAVTTNPKNLYSDELGIFVRGIHGRPGLGEGSACNWNMDWDRPLNLEYFDTQGRCVLNQECTMARNGAWSRRYTPYGFKVKADKHYGAKHFDYQFFSQKPYERNKQLVLRCAGNDNTSRVRDPLVHEIVMRSGLNIDAQGYQPVVHYINGLYRGTINLREPNNKNYVYANYGYDEDEIDFFEIDGDSGYVQKCGDRTAWERLYKLAKTATNEQSYQEIQQLVDIDELCNYLAVELYLGNDDWPKNNLKAWRPLNDDGRFRFILYDVDHTFSLSTPFNSFAAKKYWTWNQLYGEPVTNISGEVEIVTIVLNLFKNKDFCKHFVDAFCIIAGSVFDPARCEAIIREVCTRVETIQLQNDNGYGKNVSPWETGNIQIGKYKNRQEPMYTELKNYSAFGLSGITPQRVKLESDVPAARILINGQVVPTGSFSGKLFAPITLRAEAPAGYTFDGWYKTAEEETEKSVFVAATTWRYYDKGSLDATPEWKSESFSDTNWPAGLAPLGYASSNSAFRTVLDYGGNAKDKHPTYYFRRKFTLSQTPTDKTTFNLNYDVDDGLIVYINGKEAARYNMPDGDVSYSTFSTTYTAGNPDHGTLKLPSNLFHQGSNIIAVEVHNNSLTSSDIYWNASLTSVTTGTLKNTLVSRKQELALPEGDDLWLTACYKPQSSQDGTPQHVVINEVSAANSMNVNDYFKKADWIELYNPTADTIDLAGIYLSDNLQKPCKCQLSVAETGISTLLEPQGHKVIWCDGNEPLSQLHASFKLSNADTCVVMITAEDGSWADTLVYRNMEGTQSIGRFPDGAEQLYLMSRPTIGKQNTYTTLSNLWDAPPAYTLIPQEDETSVTLPSRDAGLSISAIAGQLVIHNEEGTDATLSITTLSGALVMTTSVSFSAERAHVSLSPLPCGVYIATIRDAEGKACSIKFSR